MDAGIRAFVGPNGSGKTLAAVALACEPAWREGVPVVSNLTLSPDRLGFDASLFVPLRSWRQISALRDCVLLLDEVQATFPSRESQRMPAELGRVLNQLRKPNVQLVWTGPAWARADLLIRECTQYVTLCRGYLPDVWVREPAPRFSRRVLTDERGRRERVRTTGWLPNRLFRWTTFDAFQFEEFTARRAEKMRSVSNRWYWRSSHLHDQAYATGENVALLDHLDVSGICAVCDGQRSRHRCTCEAPAKAAAPPKGRRS